MHLPVFRALSALVCLMAGSVSAATIQYVATLEVNNAFTGVPLGTIGHMYVKHEDDLFDWHLSSGNPDPRIGWYGAGSEPGAQFNAVEILWDFGNGDVAYDDDGSISIGNTGFTHDLYSMGGGYTDAMHPYDSITKGAFAAYTHRSGNSMLLGDSNRLALSSDDLVQPVFADFNTWLSGSLAFEGNSAFVGYLVTDIDEIASTNGAAALTAGSPVSITQAIDTPASSFGIGFDYIFDQSAVGNGILQVLLDGIVLATIDATIGDTLQHHDIVLSNPSLLDREAIDLTFLWDADTGSSVYLDNISAPGTDLLNGDFQTHSLSAWTDTGPGTASAQEVSFDSGSTNNAPLPASVFLLFAGLVGLRVFRPG